MANTMIDNMVQSFLGWKLPKDFSPDAGISFKPTKPYEGDELGNSWWPIGTNLLSAEQAKEMVRHMLAGSIPEYAAATEEEGDAYTHGYFDGNEYVVILRAALVGMIGADTEDELRQMEAVLRVLPAPDSDKAVSINAIHALLATMGK